MGEQITKAVCNRDIFEQKSYDPLFEDQVDEEYEDLVYLVRRGK